MAKLTTQYRHDRAELLPATKNIDGTLFAEGIVARPGILPYLQPDGTVRRELVPISTLANTASLETLGRVPVTLEHPRDAQGLDVDVTPDNVQEFQVGDLDGDIDARFDERTGNGFVRVKLAVRRADAVTDVETGERVELSPGYAVVLDETPGKHPIWGDYDAIQVYRQYNHTAIVRDARGGPTVRMRTDGVASASMQTRHDAYTETERKEGAGDQPPTPAPPGPDTGRTTLPREPKSPRGRRGDSMDPITELLLKVMAGEMKRDAFDAALVQIEKREDADISALQKDALQKAMDKMEAKIKEKDKAIDALQAKVDQFEAAATEAKEKKTDSADEFAARAAWAKERAELTALATERKIDGVDDLDNPAIKETIIRRHLDDRGVTPPETMSADYVAASWDQMMAARKDAGETAAPLSTPDKPAGTVATHRDAADEDDPFEVQERNRTRTNGAD